ncbi:hypothetical protein Q9189_007668 [Teloschistes chrysophthalmus]
MEPNVQACDMEAIKVTARNRGGWNGFPIGCDAVQGASGLNVIVPIINGVEAASGA